MSKAITVVGGTYGEECSFPARQVFRGSGGRAAAILSSLGAQVTLATVTGPELAQTFRDIAATLGYMLNEHSGQQDIWFRYRHPMSRPMIFPDGISRIPCTKPIKADLGLVFGMVEGRLPISAKRAVYDPQDGVDARAFDDNGSTADDLAIVVSQSEGTALTNEVDPKAMANRLLADNRVSAVVVKCGPQGALVQTRNSLGWVRPFPTQNVYKIGSGDAFSAAFAFAWLIEERDALSAAWFASRLTAAYVESSRDRFSAEDIADFQTQAQLAYKNDGAGVRRELPRSQIYLAGPFFTTAQQWLIDEVRDALGEMGLRVFSPIHDVGSGPAEEVAPADLAALDSSGIVLALVDGTDAGTMFEVGYARGKGIPVVAVAEALDATPLTMVLGSGCIVTNDLTTGIYAVFWQLMGDV